MKLRRFATELIGNLVLITFSGILLLSVLVTFSLYVFQAAHR